LRQGRPPLFEPGLEDLVRSGVASKRLSFTSSPGDALTQADVVWVTYDTPVDDDDRADVDFVVERVARLFPHVPDGATVLVSSQVPVGTTARIEREFAHAVPGVKAGFAYSPENLRLGKAIDVFLRPDRVVVGVRAERDRTRIEALLRPITERIEWMAVESAEMSKHAINAFLALSISFANEVAEICEEVGADAREVERALKSETRIGPRAYLSPGAAFAGGTLARDVLFLAALGRRHARPTDLVTAIKSSNDAHRLWAGRRLEQLLGDLKDQTVAVWGLTYKPGTDTLRRSSAVELGEWLLARGARVNVHDPAVRGLPEGVLRGARLCPSPVDALRGATALVLATEWSEYQGVSAHAIVEAMESATVLDAGAFLKKGLADDRRVRYVTVGRASA
jgi:UDPglucose 6-dehydrogenase